MTEKYEDVFWGQVDFLHQKYRRQFTSFNYFIDMLNKFIEASSEFSKKIQSVINKNHKIIENHSKSMYEAAENFVQLFESFINEFKEVQNNIKKQIIEPIFKPTIDMFNRENELFNQYNDLRNAYLERKSKTGKYYNNYLNKMKQCENLIFNSKQVDLMLYIGEKDKNKNLKNANHSIKEAKSDEEKYIASIEKVNKAREKEINNQEELLKYYKKLDIQFYEKIKMGFGIYFNLINKLCNSIISINQFFGKSYNKISIENDMKDFIVSYKMEKNFKKLPNLFHMSHFQTLQTKKKTQKNLIYISKYLKH